MATTIEETSTSAATAVEETTTIPTTSPAPPPTEQPAPFTETYSARGGSITVTWNGSSFSLDAVSPAPGYVADIRNAGGSRVRVDFYSDSDQSRVDVRVEEGQVIVRID